MSGQAMGGGDRLVGVTGSTQGGLLRIVDVDISGNPIGEPTFLPANVPQTIMVQGPDGFLVEATEVTNEEIDWSAHESSTGRIAEDGSVEEESDVESIISDGKVNPALAAFPDLQG